MAKISKISPSRDFSVGRGRSITIRHVADVDLEPDEQITLTTPAGGEFDVVRKDWGFYATPSLNGRLRDHGLRGLLVRDPDSGRAYVLLVERGREEALERYLEWDGLQVLCWLDSDEAIERLAERVNES